MTDSYVHVTKGTATAFVGHDAIELLRARTLIQALKAAKVGMRLTRTATPMKMLAMASTFTGKSYKRGEYDRAIEDMRQWCLAMELALPVVADK